ncbi:MAG: PEP-CTERM sorting domain-containing protein [Bryobacterales bacterium]|nr:PEP-CTERM sorting domain-containing protein [Bryobacterales bacterium]
MKTHLVQMKYLLLTAVLLGIAGVAQAGMLVDVQSGTLFARGTFTNFGYTVTFSQAVRVDALGLWDYQGNGLTDAHPVGLWDINGNLLASATVDNNSTVVASVNSNHAWLFTSISPVHLSAGSYVLGAYYPTAADFFISSLDVAPAEILVNPLATYGGSRYISSIESLTFPSSVSPADWDPGFFGPNALVTAVPEPGTLGLIGAGLLFGYLRLRRRTIADSAPV